MKTTFFTLFAFLPSILFGQPGGGGGVIIHNICDANGNRINISTDSTYRLQCFLLNDTVLATTNIHSTFGFRAYQDWVDMALTGAVKGQYRDYNTSSGYDAIELSEIYPSGNYRMLFSTKLDTMIVDFINVIGENPLGMTSYIDTLSFNSGYSQYKKENNYEVSSPYDTTWIITRLKQVEYNLLTSKKKSTIEIDPHLFYQSKLVSIRVDKTLYEFANPDYFYIKVEIKNTSKKTIGIDLNDSWQILYPNQWGMYDTTYRMIINESQVIPDKLDEKKEKKLITDFKDKKLKELAPSESFVYYTEFNANGRSKIDKETGNYFILTIDGQLFLTDGEKCEGIICDGSKTVQRELVLKMPIKWETIKNQELIIERD